MDESHHLGNHSLKHFIADESALKRRLSLITRSSVVTSIAQALGDDCDLHLVGGTVRDCLLGEEASDIDLSSRISPEVCQQRLNANGLHVVATGLEHGTITVVLEGTHVELTTFRKPGNRTESSFSDSIDEDLSGRDFTINAMAFSVKHEELIDPFGGIADLRASRLRAVGDARTRFEEDPLRILRGVRFGASQDRSLESSTKDAMGLLAPRLSSVSIERIRDELLQILLSPFASLGMEQLKELDLLKIVLPEILPSIGFEQNEHHIHDVFEHTLWVLDRAPRSPRLRLAALFHDFGKPDTLSVDEDGGRHFYRHELMSESYCKEAMERLRFSKKLTKEVSTLVRTHMRPLDCGPSGVRRLIRDLGPLLEDWIELKRADAPPKLPDQEFHALLSSFRDLIQAEQARKELKSFEMIAVDGNDLLKLGVKKGPMVGRILESLREMVIEDPEKNEKNLLIEKAKELMESN